MRNVVASLSLLHSFLVFGLATGQEQHRNLRQASPTFRVDTVTIGGAEHRVEFKVLRNIATGESIDIAYTHGGRVDAIRLKSPVTGQVREIIVGSGRSVERFFNMGWTTGEMLMPFANRIANGTYELQHKTYYMHRTDHVNAMHGFLQGKDMHVVEELADQDHASVTLGYVFNNASDVRSQPQGYPFHLSVEVTYALDSQGLSVKTLAKNLAEEGGPLPFYMGMHPYFLVQDVSKSSVLFDSCSGWNQILVDDKKIPTTDTKPFHGFSGEPIGGSRQEPTQWDTGFMATASASQCPLLKTEVFDPGFGDSHVLLMNADEFKWVQVFTGGTPRFGQAIAIEPMSGETDAFNNHQANPLLLQAGESWQGTVHFLIAAPSERALQQQHQDIVV